MSLLIPNGPLGDFETFRAWRDSIDFNEITRSRAQILRRVAKRHEIRIGNLFEAGQATEEQFRAACEFEENLQVFILTGVRPNGLTATV